MHQEEYHRLNERNKELVKECNNLCDEFDQCRMEAKDKAHQLVEVLNETHQGKHNQLLIEHNELVEVHNELIATNERNKKIREEKERRRNRSRCRS